MSLTVVWTTRPRTLHAMALAVVAEITGRCPDDLRVVHTCARCGSDEHGRPSVPGAGVAISLSRSADLAVAAVSSGPAVGVDLEARRRDAVDLARWVRTEAVLKLTGTGLTIDPGSVDFSATAGVHRIRRWPAGEPRPDCVVIDLDAGPDHVAALATPSAEPVVSRRWEGSGA